MSAHPRNRPLLALLASLAYSGALAQDVPGCGNLSNAFGPYDYRDPKLRNELSLVEVHHFTPQVEQLVRGQSSAEPLSDIVYTLRAFPNHHRALNSIGRFELGGGKILSGQIPSADCYFRRAVAFRPEDQQVRLLYGIFLSRKGDADAALEQYEAALEIAPESPEVNYNAALYFLDRGDLARAKQLADVAYAAGYPLPGLRDRIAAAEARAARNQ